jgi:hypothetical protein
MAMGNLGADPRKIIFIGDGDAARMKETLMRLAVALGKEKPEKRQAV